MSSDVYPVSQEVAEQALLTAAQYETWYAQSLSDPETFWGEQGKCITWYEPWEKVLSGGFDLLDQHWFQGAKLNVAYNCLDRHLETRGQQAAIIWESDDGNASQIMTYQALHEQVCRLANVLKHLGVTKGDRVCLYLTMIPEVVIAMLACARIGAIHSVVFAGFSAEALRTRIIDADCCLVITANEGVRGHKKIALKENVDAALIGDHQVKHVIVVQRTSEPVAMHANRDHWYHERMATAEAHCQPAIMDAEDPLFILYTSGSTGKPKGILHGCGGYLVYAAMTHRYVFDYHDKDVYWCTADVGWVTGHSYGVYGPLANGATTLIFEGVPNYPTPSRYFEIIDQYQVNIFYTAPTAIRALRREGDAWVKKTSRDSLRILGSVGEPIDAETWEWYYHVVGNGRCPIVDTWWQTETGGIMLSALPGAMSLKPGSAARPFFGVEPQILDEQGHAVLDGSMGHLVIKQPWPGMLQTIYGNPARYRAAYFATYPGYYLTGDLARRDQDGYYWIAGRSDDVLKISGHRLGTQEVEGALCMHPAVAEAGVVAIPDAIKGESIYAYVTLKTGYTASAALQSALIQTVRQAIGAIAEPDHIQFAESLPKTRSGKILRRLLRKIAERQMDDLGDLSTLADPAVVKALIEKR